MKQSKDFPCLWKSVHTENAREFGISSDLHRSSRSQDPSYHVAARFVSAKILSTTSQHPKARKGSKHRSLELEHLTNRMLPDRHPHPGKLFIMRKPYSRGWTCRNARQQRKQRIGSNRWGISRALQATRKGARDEKYRQTDGVPSEFRRPSGDSPSPGRLPRKRAQASPEAAGARRGLRCPSARRSGGMGERRDKGRGEAASLVAYCLSDTLREEYRGGMRYKGGEQATDHVDVVKGTVRLDSRQGSNDRPRESLDYTTSRDHDGRLNDGKAKVDPWGSESQRGQTKGSR